MEQRLYYSLVKTQNRLHKYVTHVLKEKGIIVSPAQLGILFLLKEKNNSSMSYVSKELELDNSAITRSIDRLERLGMVKRVLNNNDRREYKIEITSAGVYEVEKAKKVINDINAFLEKRLKKERLELFKEILSELTSLLNKELGQ